MPEPTTPDGTTTETSGSTSTAGDTFTPITSQEELDKAIGPRLERERRSKFGDYDELKDKASKYDQLEQANKSEIERANERAQQAEAKVGELPTHVAAALRTHLVALHEISDEDAELFLTATDPELLLKQVTGLIGRAGAAVHTARRNGAQVPGEGSTPKPEDNGMRTVVRGLFANG